MLDVSSIFTQRDLIEVCLSAIGGASLMKLFELVFPDAEQTSVVSPPVPPQVIAGSTLGKLPTFEDGIPAPAKPKRVHRQFTTPVKKNYTLGSRLQRNDGMSIEDAIFAVLDLDKAGKRPVDIMRATGVSYPTQRRWRLRECDPRFVVIIKRWERAQRKAEREAVNTANAEVKIGK